MSHPRLILSRMWFWRKTRAVETTGELQPRCLGILVLHADGVLDCGEAFCATDSAAHEFWMPCVELEAPCGCLGDEGPLELLARAA